MHKASIPTIKGYYLPIRLTRAYTYTWSRNILHYTECLGVHTSGFDIILITVCPGTRDALT